MTHLSEPTGPTEPVDDNVPAGEELEMLFWRFGADARSAPDDELDQPVPARRRHRHSWRRRAGQREPDRQR